MNKTNSTVVSLCRTCLVEYYLAKEFVIFQLKSENLRSVHNKSKQRKHAVNIHKTDFFMAYYTEFYSVENIINKLHIQSGFYYGYIYNLYHDKQDIIDELFCQCIKPFLKYIIILN